METITDLYFAIKTLDNQIKNYVGTQAAKTDLINKKDQIQTILDTKINLII